MKKFLFLLSYVFISMFVYSQQKFQIPLLEINVGINHITFNDEEKTGLGYGFSIKKVWFREKHINLVSGSLFEVARYFKDYEPNGQFCSYKNMHYSYYTLRIPLMARLSAGKKYRFFIETGPSLDLNIANIGKGAEVCYDPINHVSNEKKVTVNVLQEGIDVGANIGIGLIFPIKSTKIIMTATYHTGLMKYYLLYSMTKYVSFKIGILI